MAGTALAWTSSRRLDAAAFGREAEPTSRRRDVELAAVWVFAASDAPVVVSSATSLRKEGTSRSETSEYRKPPISG